MTWLAQALELVFPQECVGCKTAGVSVCRACLRTVDDVHDVAVSGLANVWAAGRYSGLLRAMIIMAKERNDRSLLTALGGLLRMALDRCSPGVVAVPVPASRGALRARGCNIVRDLARAGGIDTVDLLRVAGRPRDQVGLGRADRLANVRGAFAATATGSGPVVVVDDVVTSGATLTEAQRALSGAGFQVVGHCVVASAVYSRQD